MINSGAFAYVDLLSKSADYAWTRNEVISSNIANVDTPNYKRQDVSFESVLSAAVSKAGSQSVNLTQTVRNINYNHVQPVIYTDNANMSFRIDGNNVDIDQEEIELASNQLYYQGIMDSMTQEFSRLKTAMSVSN